MTRSPVAPILRPLSARRRPSRYALPAILASTVGLVLLCLLVSALAPAALLPYGSTQGLPRGGPAPSPGTAALRPSARGSTVPEATARPSIVAPTDGWLLFQGDASRTGISADLPPSTNHVAWSVSLPTTPTSNAPVTAPLVTSGGLVYVASTDDWVYAYSAVNGSVIWSFDTGGSVTAAPEVQSGLVFVASQSGNLDELNATTGALTGKFRLGDVDQESAPLPVNGQVVVPCWGSNVCSFPIGGGPAATWNVSVGGSVEASVSADPANDQLFVATSTGVVRELALGSGTYRWNYTFASPFNAISTTPVVGSVTSLGRTMVFVFASSPGQQGALAAFNETSPSGTITHPFYRNATIAAGFGASSPAFTGSLLVEATENGKVLGFDPTTGEALWNVAPWTGNTNVIASSSIDAQGTVLVGLAPPVSGGGELAELSDASGSLVTTVPCPTGAVTSTPAIDSSAIYFAGDDGTLYAVGTAAPSDPNGLTATGGNASIALTWSAPSNDGGLALGGYEVAWGPVHGAIGAPTAVAATATGFTITGLTNGIEYDVNVAAWNSAGTGPNATSSALPSAPPGVPTGVSSAVEFEKFILRWTPPSFNGGFPIDSDLVQWWNASSWVHHNASVGPASMWVQAPDPDGVEVFAEVAAVTSHGQGAFTGIVSGTPWNVVGVLELTLLPTKARGAVSVSVNGATAAVSGLNGTARIALTPGMYWVNASGSGWLAFDQEVQVTSGNVTTLTVTMSPPPQGIFGLSELQGALLIVGIVALAILVLVFVAFRIRRLQEIAHGDEEDEEEPTPGEGISEARAKELLEAPETPPPTPRAYPVAVASDEGEPEEGGAEAAWTVEGGPAGPAPSAPERPPEDEDDEPEGASGRLGEYLRHRREAKETLKSPNESTPDEENGTSPDAPN